MPVGLVVLFGLMVAVFDLRRRKIPNLLIGIGFITTMALRYVVADLESAVSGILGGIVALVLTLPLYWLRGMAAGDVKALMVLGSMVGVASAPLVIGMTLVLGGVAAMAWAWRVRSMGEGPREVLRSKLPYGVAIGMGTWVFGVWQVAKGGLEAVWVVEL